MKIGILKAKVERNNSIKYSRKYYIDETSDIIKKLNSHGKSALLGIQNKKGVYTIIGEEFIYYLTSSGKRGEISLKKFSDELHENGCRIGKGFLNYKLNFMYKNREFLSTAFPDCRKVILENFSLDIVSERISKEMRASLPGFP